MKTEMFGHEALEDFQNTVKSEFTQHEVDYLKQTEGVTAKEWSKLDEAGRLEVLNTFEAKLAETTERPICEVVVGNYDKNMPGRYDTNTISVNREHLSMPDFREILLGIVAGFNIFGFGAVVCKDVFDFYNTHKDDFNEWHHIMEKMLEIRDFLKKETPILYEKLSDLFYKKLSDVLFSDVFLEQLWQATLSGMPDALSTPDATGKLTGVIIGKFGKMVAESRFTMLGAMQIILSTVATRLVMSIPSAINITVGEYEKLGQDIIHQLKKMDVSISEDDIQTILKEIAEHPEEIKKIFEDIKLAFEKAGFAMPAPASQEQ